ncbi:MAG: DoxX family protein [Acidobacteria bacterium]|nr:DoxX family protein [Acidobacteriota bacterium]
MFGQEVGKYTPWALTLLRLIAAFLFWQYGAQKFLGWLGREPVPFFELRWFAGVLEFWGSILMALGWFTRPVAFLLCGEMAVAYFISHAPRGFWPILNGGQPAVFFCFIYLLLWTAGPGRLALDNVRAAHEYR